MFPHFPMSQSQSPSPAVVIFRCQLDQLLPHQPLHLPCDHCPIDVNAVFSQGGATHSSDIFTIKFEGLVPSRHLVCMLRSHFYQDNKKQTLFNGHVHLSSGWDFCFSPTLWGCHLYCNSTRQLTGAFPNCDSGWKKSCSHVHCGIFFSKNTS